MSGKAIRAKVSPARRAFAAGLARRAALLARAHGENVLRARRQDPKRWRLPRLLWPLFTKGK